MKKILYIGNQLAQKGKTASSIDTLGPLLEKEGYQLRYASSISNVSVRMLAMMHSTFRSRKWAEVVLIDTYSTKNFWFAIVISQLCKFLNLKYIPILHGGNLPARLDQNPKVMGIFLHNAHAVVSPSDYLGTAFAKAGYHNITIINNFIEIENYPFQERSILEPKLLWVRSFAEIYHPQMAVRVLHLLKEEYPKASLTMVGPEKDGALQSSKLLAQKLQVEVHFTGLLSKKQWIEISKDHSIFINTTHFDNLPVSLIEAMALGLPVVSTDVGGISYLIQHKVHGKLVPDGDVRAMVENIQDLMRHPKDVFTIITHARERSLNYSWKEVSQQWNALLAL
ncbi:glycosyltransferase family 4 protein [Nonlabens sp.]|uniref:glycosyltransferase family 4 protein n=1 Tax=Nonlabens sp. TaxID=1888209 RepID=UPI0025D4ABAD|nr:glycosyltransferase family 4 protein [Nonlabens sp.]